MIIESDQLQAALKIEKEKSAAKSKKLHDLKTQGMTEQSSKAVDDKIYLKAKTVKLSTTDALSIADTILERVDCALRAWIKEHGHPGTPHAQILKAKSDMQKAYELIRSVKHELRE